jgi:cytochrome P450
MSTASAVYYDPYKPEITADPYPVFRRLREESPLYYNEQYDFYALSRFDDVERGLLDRETYTSGRGAILEIIKSNAQFPAGTVIFEDPPVHRGHRNLLARLFTPKRLNALEAKIQQVCAECLDPLVSSGGFDVIADFGAKMPIRIIGQLLGIPDEDHAAIRERVDATLRTEAGKPMDTTSTVGQGFEDYIDWRSKNPSDDVMTELLNTEFKDETGTTRKVTREEALTMVNVVAGAGNETTTRLIGWTGKVLAEHPDQRRELARNRELIPAAIEELLRFEPPAPHIARYVSRDMEYYGKKVPAGSAMLFLTGSANRDDRRFPDGDRFNIHREQRPHMAFGYGIHACLGRVLARLEGRIALEEMLKRFPDWHVDYDHAVLSPTSTVRGWEALPVYVGSKRAAPVEPKPAVKIEAAVPVEGKWTLMIKGPTGELPTTLVLERVNGVLTGSQTGQGVTSPISDAKHEGNQLTWTQHVTKPMKLKVDFTGEINGRQIAGKMKAGFMGSYKFTGTKDA